MVVRADGDTGLAELAPSYQCAFDVNDPDTPVGLSDHDGWLEDGDGVYYPSRFVNIAEDVDGAKYVRFGVSVRQSTGDPAPRQACRVSLDVECRPCSLNKWARFPRVVDAVLTNGTISDYGTGGVELEVGSGSACDPVDGPHAVWPMLDNDGNRVPELSTVYQYFLHILLKWAEITEGGDTSNTYMAMGISNGRTLDGGSTDGIGIAVKYASSTRTIGIVAIEDGTTTFSWDSSPDDDLRFVLLSKQHNSNNMGRCFALGLDDQGATAGTKTVATNLDVTGDLYVWVAAGRADTVTGTHTLRMSAAQSIFCGPYNQAWAE